MLKLNFSQIVGKLDVKKVNQYLYIMNKVDPEDAAFQEKFSGFYQINDSGWKSPAMMRPLFFNVFSAFNEMIKKGCSLNYEMIVIMLSKISGMPEKSFASKMLHTFCKNEPIIDSKVIGQIKKEKQTKFKGITGYKYSLNYDSKYKKLPLSDKVNMAIDLHNCLKEYYDILKSAQSTISYINDFDNWCNSQGINPSLISDTKKIDFWMWLA